MSEARLPPVYLDLSSIDGNAYSLMGNWAAAARRARWPKVEIDRVLAQAKSGDYNHLICILSDNCEDPPPVDGEYADDDGDCEDE